MELKEILQVYLDKIDEVIQNGKFKDNWQSLAYHKVPDWYSKAKFGVFIHWGAYTVPEFGNEWYPRHMYRKGNFRFTKQDYYNFHRDNFGPQTEFGYKDFIPMFKAEKFNAKEWADLFQQSGAKFVMPVAEHHDGFQMYDSELSEWCATKKGPQKDILQLLKDEIEARDMVFAASSHRAEHYWFMSGGMINDSDVPDNMEYGDIYWPAKVGIDSETNTSIFEIGVGEVEGLFLEDWLARTCEIVDKYQPQIVYFDGGIGQEGFKPYLMKFAAYYYNRAFEWGKEVTINYKDNAFAHTVGVRDIERGQLAGLSADFWQNDTSVANRSWAYAPDNDYKEAEDVVKDLVDVVSKNGSLLLNIGPKADGTIPENDKNILLKVGEWLKINGEGIYETTYWKTYGEGPTLVPEGHMTDVAKKSFTSQDFRFTYKPGVLYVFCLNWPEDSVVHIKSVGNKNSIHCSFEIKDVKILGSDAPVVYRETSEYLTIIGESIVTDYPVCIKITFE